MAAEKNSFDYPKLSAGLFTILIGITGWFSVTMYEKITKIEENVQQLLIASSAEKVEIQNLKERVNNLEGNHRNNVPSKQVLNTDALLPNILEIKKGKRYIACK
jgi:hypothetical protein